MEHEAPENANKKLQEAMDTKIAELRTESQNPLSSLPTRDQRTHGRKYPYTPFWKAGYEPVRPMLEPTCRAKCAKDVNELNEKRPERATESQSKKYGVNEKRLSWRLATMTPEGVSEKRAREAQECEVRAQEARECEKNEKRAREARKTFREECEREKRAQVARVSPEKDVMVKELTIEPLNEEEEARIVEDQAGEENALKAKRQPRRPSAQEIAAHEAGGHYPYRDWCRACVGGAGRSDAHKRRGDEHNEIPVVAMDYAFFFFCDEHEERLSESETQATEILKGATPFLVIRVKPCLMTWSFLVRCKGLEDQTAIRETVDLLNKLGYPELIMRTDGEPAIREVRLAAARELKEQHGIRVIQQNTPKYDSASAWSRMRSSK